MMLLKLCFQINAVYIVFLQITLLLFTLFICMWTSSWNTINVYQYIYLKLFLNNDILKEKEYIFTVRNLYKVYVNLVEVKKVLPIQVYMKIPHFWNSRCRSKWAWPCPINSIEKAGSCTLMLPCHQLHLDIAQAPPRTTPLKHNSSNWGLITDQDHQITKPINH